MTLIREAAATIRSSDSGQHESEGHGFETMSSSADSVSVTVLGAGNCQDVDLPELVSLSRTVNLLDIDAESPNLAVRSLLSGDSHRVRVVAPVDIADPLLRFASGEYSASPVTKSSDDPSKSGFEEQNFHRREMPSAELIRGLGDGFSGVPVEPSDIVISTCILSQLIGQVTEIAGLMAEKPEPLLLIQALRRGHLVRMLQLLRPAGCGILVTDLVSSDTVPELAQARETDLPILLAECLRKANFFSGLNPAMLLQEFRTVPAIRDLCSDVQIRAPWKWQLGPRYYAVYAVTFRRHGLKFEH